MEKKNTLNASVRDRREEELSSIRPLPSCEACRKMPAVYAVGSFFDEVYLCGVCCNKYRIVDTARRRLV